MLRTQLTITELLGVLTRVFLNFGLSFSSTEAAYSLEKTFAHVVERVVLHL